MRREWLVGMWPGGSSGIYRSIAIAAKLVEFRRHSAVFRDQARDNDLCSILWLIFGTSIQC